MNKLLLTHMRGLLCLRLKPGLHWTLSMEPGWAGRVEVMLPLGTEGVVHVTAEREEGLE